jgi:hypothetical protein
MAKETEAALQRTVVRYLTLALPPMKPCSGIPRTAAGVRALPLAA